MDKVFIERLWRSLKYEKLRLWGYQTIPELQALTADWIEFYNHRRKHQRMATTHPGQSTKRRSAKSPDRFGGVAGDAPFRVFHYAPASPIHLTRYEPKSTQKSCSLRTC